MPLFLSMLRSETAASPLRAGRALTGLRAYQAAQRTPPPLPVPALDRQGRVTLRDHGGAGRPVVFIPSLINPPSILDLPGSSLVQWLASQGHHALLVDWGAPEPSERDSTLDDHVAHLLVPLLSRLEAPPVLVGYCLGGTLALAAAALTPVAGLATIAAPWHFAGYGETARAEIARLWTAARPAAAQLGLLPMEVLQAGFWQLDPARTIAKYEAFAAMAPDSDAARAFVRLEDWANAGAPLPFAAAEDLFETLIAQDAPSHGTWRVGGTRVDPATLTCPAVEFVSRTDRIVPAATAIGLSDRRDLDAGHVGMIVGRSARTQLWEPLRNWIAALP